MRTYNNLNDKQFIKPDLKCDMVRVSLATMNKQFNNDNEKLRSALSCSKVRENIESQRLVQVVMVIVSAGDVAIRMYSCPHAVCKCVDQGMSCVIFAVIDDTIR